MNSDNPKDKDESHHPNKADRKSSTETSESDSFHSCESDSYFSYSDDEDDEENGENAASASEMSRLSESFISSDSQFRNPNQRERASSLVTPTFRYDRKKPKNLFPPTKKYRHYPITCEYCGKRFQPNELKAHKRKQHLVGLSEDEPTTSDGSASTKTERKTKKSTRSKSAGGIPRALRICYICGQLYGSKSLKIHEPKCLEKWRIQNSQLPPGMRAPEPVKPDPIHDQVASGNEGYDVPAFDPAAEAAFRSHLASLIPCAHCSRTFSPDRIQKHQSCCIERPRKRKCVTPVGGEISR